MLLLMNKLNLIEPIQKALETKGYTKPTPIQEQAIPHLLEGRDLLGAAQTGTGKTAAFAIPILQDLTTNRTPSKGKKQIKSLVIAPTRELAIQIGDSFKEYGKNLNLKTLVIYGGVSQHPQTKQLKQGVDIVVATPGRLLDLINQRHVKLQDVKHFVLDEADMMLDMGMITDVQKIVKYLPKERQTMCFSATMPKAIEKLTNEILKNPVKVEVTPVSSTVDVIKQEVFFVDPDNKMNLLVHLLKDKTIETALVFSRTKHGANKIVKSLIKNGFTAEAIHGNKTQKQRQRALNNFKSRRTKILVATDIAARGIDIDELSHVFNYNLPEVPETYVHRIGRTGRAGGEGVAVSFCDHGEKSMLKGIEKLIGKSIPVNSDHPFPLKDKTVQPPSRGSYRGKRSGGKGRGKGRGNRNQGRRRRNSSPSNKGGNKGGNKGSRNRRPSSKKR